MFTIIRFLTGRSTDDSDTSFGYKAAKLAMARLEEVRAADEEVVAVVETDACSADAVQVLTGCTFGKGNFLYRDHGKMALTLFSRNSGRGLRVQELPQRYLIEN